MNIIDKAKQALPDIEFDLLVAEQLDDNVPCTRGYCSEKAVAWFVCGRCNHVLMNCSAHVRAANETGLTRKISCLHCGHLFPCPLPWLPL